MFLHMHSTSTSASSNSEIREESILKRRINHSRTLLMNSVRFVFSIIKILLIKVWTQHQSERTLTLFIFYEGIREPTKSFTLKLNKTRTKSSYTPSCKNKEMDALTNLRIQINISHLATLIWWNDLFWVHTFSFDSSK